MADPTTLPPPAVSPKRVVGERALRRWPTIDLTPDPAQPRKCFDEEALLELGRNLVDRGQQIPLLVFIDPTNPARAVIVDGERRFRAALAVGLQELDVIVLPARPNPAELLLAQVSVNQFREALTPAEECRAFRTLLDELKLSQSELAAKLGVSASKVCKVLARERIDPKFLPAVDSLEAAVLPLIAALPVGEQAAAVEYAATRDENGKRPTRDEVRRHLEAKAAAPKPGPKAKWLGLTADGRAVRLAVRPDDSHDSLIEGLKQLITFVNKNRNVPVANLNLVAG